MSLNLPDPIATARAEAKRLNSDRTQYIDGGIDRIIADAPQLDRKWLLDGVTKFHLERLAKVPSVAKFPESKPWVENVLAFENELKAQGLSDTDRAVRRSVNDFLAFRGYGRATTKSVERCRVAYLPETDRGQLHIKNVDDPATFWTVQPPMEKNPVWKDPKAPHLVWDGVGSGLHIDDEPKEIFPLSPPHMYLHYASDVPAAVEFLTRYKSFWGGQNIVLHDAKKRSVAIEKCSYNFIEVFYPDRTGRSWCSGMATRDPKSPQGRYQRLKRKQYIKATYGDKDNCDVTFWNVCQRVEERLASFLSRQGPIKAQEIIDLFTTAYPEGLCKAGVKVHPMQPVGEYTLITRLLTWTDTEFTESRWSRGGKPGLEFPKTPEVVVSRKPGT